MHAQRAGPAIPTLKPILVILALCAVQQVFFAIVWLTMARLRMSRRAAAHWGVATALVAVGMGAVLSRPWLPPGLGIALPNLLQLAACLLVARGLLIFVRRPGADRTLLTLAGVAALAVVVVNLIGLSLDWTVVIAGGAMAWLLLRAALDVRRGLVGEFGRLAALGCSLPLWIMGGLLLTRVLMTLAGVKNSAAGLETGGAMQLTLTLAIVLLAMSLHLSMGSMLILRLVNRLRHQSQHDTLTQLLNRRAFTSRLEAERARQRRSPGPMALLVVDLDHFKAVNDRFGHAAGDAVLVAAAALLRRHARDVDTVSRMGGEEFALLLPDTDRDGACRVAERMLAAFRALALEVDGVVIRVRASIGIAVSTHAGEGDPLLFQQADRALYLAKAGGRDRVVCAGALNVVDAGGARRHRVA